MLAKVLYTVKADKLMNIYWGRSRLTVLAYHRIADSYAPDFDFYAPNVSATPEMFERHLEYIGQHFNVVDIQAVVDFVENNKPLPDRPLLITFDDGYLDNYEAAFPALKKYGFPAVIFLMTRWMTQTHERPWWDECAYYFFHTPKTSADLPLIGKQDFPTSQEKDMVREKLMKQLKLVSETEKRAYLNTLPQRLEVSAPQDKTPIFVNWDQVRELVANGVACQPHTVNHPILTRISAEQVDEEIKLSRDHIIQETGQQAVAFAYPNGRIADYNQAALDALRKYGYKVAFTLTSGPMPNEDVKKHPLEIRRVYLGRRDNFEVFVMKTMGASALGEPPVYVEQK
ncbi:MAG: polysaccharide deacetylase family protein [Anaerolineae bacterium]|nr:polysaccharide deacetylase family protein [Anaerolineae bacterium]